MSKFWRMILPAAILLTAAPVAQAQQNAPPHVGYVYPAGGRQGTTFTAVIGGQHLNNATGVFFTEAGVSAAIVEQERQLTPKEQQELREKLAKLQEKRKKGERLTPEEIKTVEEIKKRLVALGRRLTNPALSEFVSLQITVASDSPPGKRELRLATSAGLSNPLSFCVGQLPEFTKPDWKNVPNVSGSMAPATPPTSQTQIVLPAMLNGQIPPGGVDKYRFQGHIGQQLVVAVGVRELIPYLADAVPGWFQAAVTIYDSEGNELAYADHYRFNPDPVLHYKIPRNGQYVLEIRDTLYRGREDFVYRIALGELPFVTSIFPLGGRAGAQTAVALRGWNLPLHELIVDAKENEEGLIPLSVRKGKLTSNRVSFAVDTLPECLEQEPNDEPAEAQRVTLPIIINGRIDPPGDWDVFRFDGRAGQKIVAEVDARKLDSPLDSVLKLTDSAGRQLAFNDDYLDKGTGLSTHHADSLLTATLAADGVYYLHLGDAQRKGGPEYAYRLRISEPRPDFALRVTPSSVSVRAGGTVSLAVYALRKDGFSGEIALALKDAPKGFKLGGARVPAGQDQSRLVLTVPNTAQPAPVNLRLEGRAMIQGREVVHRGVPAEDMMQAFIYHHLVPMEGLFVAVTERRRPMPPLKSKKLKL